MAVSTLNRIICDILRECGAIPDAEADILLVAADHAYSCTCDTCRDFWRLVGPDEDTGQYGPFGPNIGPPGEAQHD